MRSMASMCNDDWVCFDCRQAVRRCGAMEVNVPCPNCGMRMRWLGDRICVPRKADVKAWDELREQFHSHRRERVDQSIVTSVRNRHELEQEIDRLERLPADEERDQRIAKLRETLAAWSFR